MEFSGLLPLALGLSIMFQDSGTRQIVPEEFVKSRPGRATASTAGRRTTYRPTTARPPREPKAPAGDAMQLGLTIWRLRPAKAADVGARIIVQQEADAEEWTPERVESNTPMRMGERVRFSFEAPQTGYLYVIDRERYADGSTGDPFLIFPTLRTRGGENAVAPGRIIEIPGQEDRPNYFTLRQSRPDQVGELLTVIVTPKPLEGITIGNKALAISNEQIEQWEKQWGAVTEKFEMAGGAGKTWTKAEQEAGANATRQLTQDEPGPQTIYRVAVKPGAPLLVKVGLRYGKAPVRR
ncbi:MAG: DUF4384 domain-containing protein [Blastocatellia bacterium]|nr:DUF4384 domain-containing protein [Blastocatellia bacterium]